MSASLYTSTPQLNNSAMSLGATCTEKHTAGLYSLNDEPMAAEKVMKVVGSTPYRGEIDGG
jgi:hypothetical protein